jgi:hypothetical protein
MTKLLPLLAAALFATAGMASASNTLGFNVGRASGNSVEFSNVVANGNGTVALYEYQGAQQGRLLDTDTVRAGANTDVKVSVNGSVANSFLAVLTVDGQVVAQQVVRADN